MCETLEVLKNRRKWFFNGLSVPWPTSVEMVSWGVWRDIFRPVTHSFLCQSHCWQFWTHYLYMCIHFPFHSVNLSIYMFFHIINIWRLTGEFIISHFNRCQGSSAQPSTGLASRSTKVAGRKRCSPDSLFNFSQTRLAAPANPPSAKVGWPAQWPAQCY